MTNVLNTPIKDEALADLNVDDVYLTGQLVTCRDVAHRRLTESKRELPVDLRGGAIFHAGPSVRKKDDDSFEWRPSGPLLACEWRNLIGNSSRNLASR